MTRSTGRGRGLPKAPEARSPLRGRGRQVTVPAGSTHDQLTAAVASGNLAQALSLAAADASWLRLADAPALVLAQLVALELQPRRQSRRVPTTNRGASAGDEVGTLPAFPELTGGGSVPSPGRPAKPTRDPSPVRALAPLLVQLLTGLGMMPEARSRLGITLVEEPEPDVPVPSRMPARSRDRAAA